MQQALAFIQTTNIKDLHFSMLFENHSFVLSRLVKQNQLLDWHIKKITTKTKNKNTMKS